MKYFTDYKVHKRAKIGITNPIRAIAKAPNSHAAAWPALIKAQLRFAGYKNVDILHTEHANWPDYDVILLEHGMEFKGSFNIFGGEKNEYVPIQLDKMARRHAAGRPMFSLDIPMPRYDELAKKRFNYKLTLARHTQLESLIAEIPVCRNIAKCDTLYLGDSHILSVAMPLGEVRRLDGQTLHGFVSTMGGGIRQYVKPHHKDVVLYFGNIDIRHHLTRQAQPAQALTKLLQQFLDELDRFKTYYPQIQIHLVAPLWIEDPSRKIPKSGWYKGEPYYGTWPDRERLRQTMVATMLSWPYPIITWSKQIINEHGKLKFECMEGKSSVHLSPEYYQPYDPIKF